MTLTPWEILSTLKDRSKTELRDPVALEKLILDCGLYPNTPEYRNEFPLELQKYCDKGLRIWQYPNQYVHYLIMLSKRKINQYLEIGAAAGGTMLFTAEYLRAWNKNLEVWAFDPYPTLPAESQNFISNNPHYHLIKDLSQNIPKYVPKGTIFDLVLIDGDHSMKACHEDFFTVQPYINVDSVICFHDITNDHCPQVRQYWELLKCKTNGKFQFLEFVEQYNSVLEKIGKKFLGMGVCLSRSAQEKFSLQ